MQRKGLLGRPAGWIAWVALSMAGFALGFAVVFVGGWFVVEAITGDADRIFEGDGLFFWFSLTLGFSLGGAGFAAGQWLLLRRHVTGALSWVVPMAAGMAVVALLYLALWERVPLVANEVIHNLAGGAVVGFGQLAVIRQLTDRPQRWIAVSICAMAVAASVAAVLRAVLGDTGGAEGPLAMAVYAAITGTVLTRWVAARSRGPEGIELGTGPRPGVGTTRTT